MGGRAFIGRVGGVTGTGEASGRGRRWITAANMQPAGWCFCHISNSKFTTSATRSNCASSSLNDQV
eukprot:363309-Chlamydomonas_euryale.AAC.37